jgi:hypothetical protein
MGGPLNNMFDDRQWKLDVLHGSGFVFNCLTLPKQELLTWKQQ